MPFFPTCPRLRKALVSAPAAGLLALGLALAIPSRAPAPPPTTNPLLVLEELRREFHVFVMAYTSGGKPTRQQLELLAVEFTLNMELLGVIPESQLLDLELFEFIFNEEAIILFDFRRGKEAVQDIPEHLLFRRHHHKK
jgi:hypothetical protein